MCVCKGGIPDDSDEPFIKYPSCDMYDTIDIQVLPSGLFRTCLKIYTVEVRQLRVLESPLERLTC